MAARLNAGLWVERVGTHDNIADLPSRGQYNLLHKLGFKWSEPKFDKAFARQAEWEPVALLPES